MYKKYFIAARIIFPIVYISGLIKMFSENEVDEFIIPTALFSVLAFFLFQEVDKIIKSKS